MKRTLIIIAVSLIMGGCCNPRSEPGPPYGTPGGPNWAALLIVWEWFFAVFVCVLMSAVIGVIFYWFFRFVKGCGKGE